MLTLVTENSLVIVTECCVADVLCEDGVVPSSPPPTIPTNALYTQSGVLLTTESLDYILL